MVVSHPQRRCLSAPAQPAPKRFGRRWFVTRGRRVGDLFGCMSPSSGELSLERHRFPLPERSGSRPRERRGEEPGRQKTVEELAEEESRNISCRISSSVLANNTAVDQPQHHPKKPPATVAIAATTASPRHARRCQWRRWDSNPFRRRVRCPPRAADSEAKRRQPPRQPG